jgi:hypothetical protein
MQRGQDLHCDGLAQAADIGLGGVGPDDPLHAGA